ncbi:hypothetical protein SVAN01_11333 [Stagonosporopsis vannaccii]|nr:hypothetical protein SVAN01_11333 [Stagonosporopsis vannaccii]
MSLTRIGPIPTLEQRYMLSASVGVRCNNENGMPTSPSIIIATRASKKRWDALPVRLHRSKRTVEPGASTEISFRTHDFTLSKVRSTSHAPHQYTLTVLLAGNDRLPQLSGVCNPCLPYPPSGAIPTEPLDSHCHAAIASGLAVSFCVTRRLTDVFWRPARRHTILTPHSPPFVGSLSGVCTSHSPGESSCTASTMATPDAVHSADARHGLRQVHTSLRKTAATAAPDSERGGTNADSWRVRGQSGVVQGQCWGCATRDETTRDDTRGDGMAWEKRV